MTTVLDPAGLIFANNVSNEDSDKFPQFSNTSSQPWPKDSSDNFQANNGSDGEFEPFAYAPKTSKTGLVESFSTPTLAVKSDNSLLGDSPQWAQDQTSAQHFSWPGLDANSSLRSEYNLTIEDNTTNILEADMASYWQSSDFEDDAAREQSFNPQNAAESSHENQPFPSGFGCSSLAVNLATTRDNGVSLEYEIATNSTTEPDPWISVPDASPPLDPRPRRSIRRSKVPANGPYAQPKSHPCDRCSSAFGRAGDLRRHYRVHSPDGRTFHCHWEGCNRNGQRGFYRRDKFRDHQRQAHGIGSESELVLLEGV